MTHGIDVPSDQGLRKKVNHSAPIPHRRCSSTMLPHLQHTPSTDRTGPRPVIRRDSYLRLSSPCGSLVPRQSPLSTRSYSAPRCCEGHAAALRASPTGLVRRTPLHCFVPAHVPTLRLLLCHMFDDSGCGRAIGDTHASVQNGQWQSAVHLQSPSLARKYRCARGHGRRLSRRGCPPVGLGASDVRRQRLCVVRGVSGLNSSQ